MKQFLKILVFTVLLANLTWISSPLPKSECISNAYNTDKSNFQEHTTTNISLSNGTIITSEEDNEFEKIVLSPFRPFAVTSFKPIIVFSPSLCKVQYINVIIFETDNSPPEVA